MNPLKELAQYGQQHWLDDLTRRMVREGEIARRIEEDSLAGITSNPATFKAAIASTTTAAGSDYDEPIRRMSGCAAVEILERLMIEDVQSACDVFAPQFKSSAGRTGFVSLEVAPQLANDARRSIDEGRRFWRAVDRPNLFIKIPGTDAGVVAIEELLSEGINVNVTLLFRIERYEAVAQAYLRALQRRIAAGLPVAGVRSVASLFLSRIDARIDALLARHTDPLAASLRGKCAVANAKLAYQAFKSICATPEFAVLHAAGARPQELLWASTGTKSKDYPDLMYVEPLIGPDTITTLPSATAAAFADHGKVSPTLEQGVEEAGETLHALADAGIDVAQELEALLTEGIDKFTKAYDETLQTIEAAIARAADPVSRPRAAHS